jgi:hypothetical protein
MLVASEVVDILVGCDKIGGVGEAAVDKYGLDVLTCCTLIDVVWDGLTALLVLVVIKLTVVVGDTFIVDDGSIMDDTSVFVDTLDDIFSPITIVVVGNKDVTSDVLVCVLVNIVVCITREIICGELLFDRDEKSSLDEASMPAIAREDFVVLSIILVDVVWDMVFCGVTLNVMSFVVVVRFGLGFKEMTRNSVFVVSRL